mgnify:FL=1|jgi:hypothetical protein
MPLDHQIRSQRRYGTYNFRMHPQRRMTIAEKNNRNYDEAWANVPFGGEGPEDCEHKHPLTGKCMSHYDYQVWLNRR